jgi:hypothetical protein
VAEESRPEFPVRVGKCIYCGTTEGLSDEHVIPYGLQGEWKLKDASCETHGKVTSAIEGRVMGWGLANVRQKLPIRTRHKKRRTGLLPFVYHVGEEQLTELVPVTEHHGGFAMPELTQPSYLSGGTPLDLPGVLSIRSAWEVKAMDELKARVGSDTVSLPIVDRIDLARMLAKIGYAFAVGCYDGDPDAFEEVYVLPTILVGPNAGHYVGCLPGPAVNPKGTGHQITLVQTPREVITYIRLFGAVELPEYTVVVGRLRGTGGTEEAGEESAA